MTWSTRQLAEIAGTTVKAIRHYHAIGLLAIPERTPNGYKQYQTAHLVRLIQITRLKSMGVALADIAAMDGSGEDLQNAIQVIDEELAQSIARLERVRSELAVLLAHRAPLTTPTPFEPVARTLSDRDHALVTVYSQVFDGDALDNVRQLVSERGDNEDEDEFELLSEDADEAQIEAIAQDLAVVIREHHTRFPWMTNPAAAAKIGQKRAVEAIVPAVGELYNRAQLKALARATAIIDSESVD